MQNKQTNTLISLFIPSTDTVEKKFYGESNKREADVGDMVGDCDNIIKWLTTRCVELCDFYVIQRG